VIGTLLETNGDATPSVFLKNANFLGVCGDTKLSRLVNARLPRGNHKR
jgi:hypothetical protein